MKRKPKIYVIKLNRKLILALLGLIIFLIILITFFSNSKSLSIFKYNSNGVIVVDPGHGGIDGGTSDRDGLLEKDINLDTGLYLKQELIKEGFNVVMTREADESLEDFSSINASRYRRDLNARKTIINKSKPVAFVSIHVNSSKSPSARGIQVYYYPDSSESEKLAKSICDSINTNVYKNYLKEDLNAKYLPYDYFILRETEYTGVLVEIGFITNSKDKALLKDDKYKEKVAYSIRKGISKWLE